MTNSCLFATFVIESCVLYCVSCVNVFLILIIIIKLRISFQIIRQNHRMTAINTCLEIDITGQVVSDSLGASIYSGFGGQVDFMRGAMTGLDGRGKISLWSRRWSILQMTRVQIVLERRKQSHHWSNLGH